MSRRQVDRAEPKGSVFPQHYTSYEPCTARYPDTCKTDKYRKAARKTLTPLPMAASDKAESAWGGGVVGLVRRKGELDSSKWGYLFDPRLSQERILSGPTAWPPGRHHKEKGKHSKKSKEKKGKSVESMYIVDEGEGTSLMAEVRQIEKQREREQAMEDKEKEEQRNYIRNFEAQARDDCSRLTSSPRMSGAGSGADDGASSSKSRQPTVESDSSDDEPRPRRRPRRPGPSGPVPPPDRPRSPPRRDESYPRQPSSPDRPYNPNIERPPLRYSNETAERRPRPQSPPPRPRSPPLRRQDSPPRMSRPTKYYREMYDGPETSSQPPKQRYDDPPHLHRHEVYCREPYRPSPPPSSSSSYQQHRPSHSASPAPRPSSEKRVRFVDEVDEHDRHWRRRSGR